MVKGILGMGRMERRGLNARGMILKCQDKKKSHQSESAQSPTTYSGRRRKKKKRSEYKQAPSL